MVPRDTTTGSVLEGMILPALLKGGYSYRRQAEVGTRLSGGKHKVDVLAERDGEAILVSLKWQQTSGTAEQKVPYEVICLSLAVEHGNYRKAYLVLGGTGWTLRDFYVSGGLNKYLRLSAEVRILKLEDFIVLANRGQL